MNVPTWVKPGVYGAILGGAIVAIVGFSWGGWVAGGSAAASAEEAAQQGRTDLAAAICVQNFIADEGARDSLAEMKALTSSFRQRDYVEEGGWALMPNTDEAARATMTLCARMIAELEPEELPVVANGEVIEPGEVIEEDVPVVAEPDSTAGSAPAADAPVSTDGESEPVEELSAPVDEEVEPSVDSDGTVVQD
ncbi:hypothetical protein GCM10007989_36620 [Devosia pacifica]|uniref:Uncharacterized protein n=1 Tax=Devosia pacifica TaxID=1335967 RepID=A0A918SF22_9HYPH|nr:hypothetical protein [Devosia pacifica]GHA37139.1 hypothetical protein GCM10007989_36620 [Devosia pacifica]